MKKYRNASNYLQISQKRSFWAKNGPFWGQKWVVLGPKMGCLWPKNESKVSETVLSLSTLKIDEVRQVSSILYNKKYRNASNYLKISQKRSFWGKNGPFWPQNESVVSDTIFIFFGTKFWYSTPSFIHFCDH